MCIFLIFNYIKITFINYCQYFSVNKYLKQLLGNYKSRLCQINKYLNQLMRRTTERLKQLVKFGKKSSQRICKQSKYTLKILKEK